MPTSYLCASPARMNALREQSAINAIDHLVVVDAGAPEGLRQRVLLVRMLSPFPDGVLTSGDPASVREIGQVHVVGGVRVLDPAVLVAWRLDRIAPASLVDLLAQQERDHLQDLAADRQADAAHWLLVLLDRYGDHSRYRLRLGSGAQPPPGFDPVLSEIGFSFKVDCPAPFDCRLDEPPSASSDAEPELDYLARDFASFRRLMVDRLALLDPGSASDDPAELRTVLVEAVAYAADQLAYFQDAVATEAYLGTARTRPSVRRHARLLDYPMHEGCNARAYVHLAVRPGTPPRRPAGPATFLTRLPGRGPVLPADDRDRALLLRPEVFEALAWPSTLTPAHNAIAFHTWGDEDCSLPAGAVEATVVDDGLALARGDVVVLEEVRSPSDPTAEPDPTRRHVVRLTGVGDPVDDPLLGTTVRTLRWHERDALRSALRVNAGSTPTAVVRGNLVLVDHGRTVADERLAVQRWGRGLRARLAQPRLAWAARLPADATVPNPPASDLTAVVDLLLQDPGQARPLVVLRGEDERWEPVARDLLDTPASGREFVVEPENDGTARLRFGDGVLGRRPVGLDTFAATYRVGAGVAGNVGADGIRHLVADAPNAELAASVVDVRNPLPAQGGRAPESIDEVRTYAPQAFRVQQRAVTEADWVEVTQRHPHVQRAVASRRWTGSWHTVSVTADPVAGVAAAALRDELVGWLAPFRLAGYDLEVVEPRYVPLDIVFTVCVRTGFFREDVARALRHEFGTGLLPDGRRGFFHPDEFTFGDSVWLSRLVARAMAVPGVDRVDTAPSTDGNRFTRWGHPQGDEVAAGRIAIDALEIARCDSDPSTPDHGRIEFVVEGGR